MHEQTTKDTETEAGRKAWLRGPGGVSRYAGVSFRTAQNWLSDGLEAERVTARLVLVKPESVDAFIRNKAAARFPKKGERVQL